MRCSRDTIGIFLVTAIRGATLKVYEETGHCPNWERPKRVAAEVQEFMRH